MHGTRYLSRTGRTMIVALAATIAMSCLMLLALVPGAHAVPSIPTPAVAVSVRADAIAWNVTVLFGLVVLAFLGRMGMNLNRGIYSLMIIGIATLAIVPGAMAADGSTIVDAGPFALAISQIIAPTIVSVGGVLIMWVLGKVAKLVGLKVDASFRSTVDQGLDRAIGFALSKLQDRAIGGIPIDMKSQAIAVAVTYAQNAIPGALKHFGKTPSDLADMIEARFEGVLMGPDEVADGASRALRSRPTAAV